MSKNTTTRPSASAEAKTPANTAATATSAAEKIAKTTSPVSAAPSAPATAPAMTAATAAPAPEQITKATPPVSMTTTTTTAPASGTSAAGLPENYCSGGSLTDAEGIILHEYVGATAEKLAQALRPLTASAFYGAFLKSCKDLRKKKVSYTAQKNAALSMVTQAKKLVYRKRDPAPAVLVDMIEAATATVKDPATFEALYMHLDAVYSCLLMVD